MATPATILLVEDDPDFAAALRDVLEGAGYRVAAVARSCTEALAFAGEQSPDLAILDYNLEDGLNGVTLGYELASLGIPIIYLTGEITAAIQQAYEIATDFLEKPLRRSEVLGAVESALSIKPEDKRTSLLAH